MRARRGHPAAPGIAQIRAPEYQAVACSLWTKWRRRRPGPCAVAFAKPKRQPVSIDLRDCSRVIASARARLSPDRPTASSGARDARFGSNSGAGFVKYARRYRCCV